MSNDSNWANFVEKDLFLFLRAIHWTCTYSRLQYKTCYTSLMIELILLQTNESPQTSLGKADSEYLGKSRLVAPLLLQLPYLPLFPS